jgi:hypothetical protein
MELLPGQPARRSGEMGMKELVGVLAIREHGLFMLEELG